MTMEAMLAEILAKLEEMPAPWHGPPTPSPSLIRTHNDVSGEEQGRGFRASAGFPNSTPSTASAMDADAGFQSGVIELPDPPADAGGNLDILFDADGEGVDRLSRLLNSLLCDIVSRLPIKDAACTAVLSRRWSSIWNAVPPLVHPVDLAPSITTANSGEHDGEVANTTTSSLPTVASASSTPSPTSAPSQDAALDSQIGVTKLLVMARTTCSTLGLYRVVTTLMPATTSSASPMSTLTTKPNARATITKHLLATSLTSINHRQGWFAATDGRQDS